MSKDELAPAPERAAWRDRLMTKAGIAAGVLALAAAAATTESQPAQAAPNSYGIGLVGFTDNSIFTENLADAETAASRIVQMGGNAVRFVYPLNKGTAWENYTQETCNAFQAAYDHGLQPIVTFRGFDATGPGYVPQSPTEIKQFTTTAASIIWTVASNKDSQHPGGCVPAQKQFIIEGINEINGGISFNQNLGVNTPAQALMIDSTLSRALKKEAAKPEIQATVSFGEALAAGSHDVVGFLDGQAQAEKDLKLKNPYDFIDVHPYPKNPTDDPSATMAKLKGPINQIIDSSFPGVQLVWGEIGVNTVDPPDSVAKSYAPPVSNSIGVSETTQAKYITNVLKTAATEGTPWVTLFDVQDDGSGAMPASGVFYISNGNGSAPMPKSSQPAIRYQIGKYTGR